MIGLRRYSNLAQSGADSLERLPEHWEVRKLGQMGRFFKGSGGSKADETATGVPCVRYGDLYTCHDVFIVESKGRINAEVAESSYTRINHGDVLFAGSGEALDEIGKSAVNLIGNPAYCGGDVIVFRPSIEVDPRFLGYATDCRTAVFQKARFGRGITVMHIYANELKYLTILLPPLPEQHAIVRCLDDASQRIRRYIRAKERLIELLDERTRALIHEAVTGRIDVRTGQPYPAYKNFEAEWFGRVPKHWEVKRLKYLTRFVNGFAFKPSEWRDEGTPIIRIENLNGSSAFNYTDRTDLPEALRIQTGDIMFAWSGNRGTSFGSFRWDRAFDGYLNQHIFKLTEYALFRGYFFYLLRAVTKNVEDNAHGIIGLVHITKAALGAIAVPVAPREEQDFIATWLDEELARIERAARQAARQIKLLDEYRTRLIADVVTGKLDVRVATAKLREEEPSEAGTGQHDSDPIEHTHTHQNTKPQRR